MKKCFLGEKSAFLTEKVMFLLSRGDFQLISVHWVEEEFEVKKLIPYIVEGAPESIQFDEPCVKTVVDVEENEVTVFKEVKTGHTVSMKKYEHEKKTTERNLRDCKIVKRQFIN